MSNTAIRLCIVIPSGLYLWYAPSGEAWSALSWIYGFVLGLFVGFSYELLFYND